MALSTLTSKGQITIPKSIREYLGVDSGDQLEFIVDEGGRVFMSAKTLSIDDIYGMFERKKGVSIDDMNQAIANAFQKKIQVSDKDKK